MARADVEEVLRNWIREATSTDGSLPEDIDPATWVAEQFLRWRQDQVGKSLGDAEYFAECLRDELRGSEHPTSLAEAMHELTHLQEALAHLRSDLGLS